MRAWGALAAIAALAGGVAAEDEAVTTWEPVGLGGGGAMYAPASSPHDPKLLFVSCDMGGFYRSTDGGASWRMLDFRQTRGSTTCKPVFHPQAPDTVYFKGQISKDRGLTWAPIGEKPPFRDVNLMVLDADGGKTMLLGASQGLFVSTNGGVTWARVFSVEGYVVGAWVDSACVFAATDRGVYRSDDGGKTFSAKNVGLPAKDLRCFAAGRSAAGGKLLLYATLPGLKADDGYRGGVYRSDDLGEFWAPVPGEGLNKGLRKIDEYGEREIAQYTLLGVAANAAETVYVTCRGTGYHPPNHSTVYRSDDAGKTWRFVFNRDQRFRELNVENGWIPFSLTWIWGGFHTINGFAINSAHPDVALWTDTGELLQTTDGGKTWQACYTKRVPGQAKPEPEPGKTPGLWESAGLEVTSTWNYRIDPFDSRHHVICYTDVCIAHSRDGGKSWTNSSKQAGAPWSNTTYDLIFDPAKRDKLWAAMSNVHDIPHWTYIHDEARGKGGVAVSQDGGKSWTKSNAGLPEAPVPALALDPKSPPESRTLYAAVYDHGIYKSTDGGATWLGCSNGIDLKRNPHTWLVRLHEDGTLFCGVTARRVGGRESREFPEPGAVYRSSDGGANWEEITRSQPLYWPNEFAVDPRDSKVLYLAAATVPKRNEGGLYKTVDGGASWARLLKDEDFAGKGGPSYVQGMFVTLDPKDPERVYLGTDSHGLWVSHDAGKSWKQVEGLPFGNIHRVTFDPADHETVYVTTFGGGVWKGKMP
ncbi:MAG: hypothetical protein M5U26_22170 [Planctomycetota bacterium]|nr:hypothetical protein [Planctomycetota bacterium]